MDILRIIGSLILVFGLMGALLWGLKRMQMKIGAPMPGRRLHMLETVSVGPRQKIALLRIDAREVLVGLSPGQMTALGQWSVVAGQDDGDGSTGTPADQAPAETYPMTAQALLEREARGGR
jgi:flagellar protein FliO/FliZ